MRSAFSLLSPIALLLWAEQQFSMIRVNAFATWLQCYVDLDDTEIVMNHKILAPEDAPQIVHVQVRPAAADAAAENESEWMSTLEYPAETRTRINAKIQPPPEEAGAGTRALQWVMETTKGAKFIAPYSVCEGSRANGASQNDYSILEISGETDRVDLWAAWAGGHEPVSLTPRITLTRSTKAADNAAEL
jgi:hypothetical protein